MYPWIKPAGVSESRELIGLFYYRAFYRINHHTFKILFSDKAGAPVFSAATSRDGMKILLSTLTFDNPEEFKKNGPMIALKVHAVYLKCLTLAHRSICYHPSCTNTINVQTPVPSDSPNSLPKNTILQNYAYMSY